MATFPADPNLPAATLTTEIDPDFLNTLIDNINALGSCLGDLVNNTADGVIDLAIDKGIEWANTLKIYVSGGDIVIDDGVDITGGLDVTGALDITGTLTVDTLDDSGANEITVNTDIVFNVANTLEVTTIEKYTDHIDVNAYMEVNGPAGTASYLAIKGSTQPYLQIYQGSADAPNPAADSIHLYQNTSGDLRVKLRDSGVTINRTIMPYAPTAYTVINRTTDRAYDCDTVAVAELADVVGTLIYDLQQLGLVG